MQQVSQKSLDTPLILSLETATRAGSLCLMRGDAVLASVESLSSETHSTSLLAEVESLLKQTGINLREIDFFATASGPGSFTGLRIGLATIKGFAHTLGRSCVGVPTLHALAHASGVSANTCALLPAGRGEVFGQLLSVSDEGFVSEKSEPVHLPPETMIERLVDMRSLLWTGPGAWGFAELIRERAQRLGLEFVERDGPLVAANEEENCWTLVLSERALAVDVGLLALQRLRAGAPHGAENLQALYVRPSDAELNKNV